MIAPAGACPERRQYPSNSRSPAFIQPSPFFQPSSLCKLLHCTAPLMFCPSPYSRGLKLLHFLPTHQPAQPIVVGIAFPGVSARSSAKQAHQIEGAGRQAAGGRAAAGGCTRAARPRASFACISHLPVGMHGVVRHCCREPSDQVARVPPAGLASVRCTCHAHCAITGAIPSFAETRRPSACCADEPQQACNDILRRACSIRASALCPAQLHPPTVPLQRARRSQAPNPLHTPAPARSAPRRASRRSYHGRQRSPQR